MIEINNVLMPNLNKCRVSTMDMDSETFRSTDGTMYRDRIATKRKAELEFSIMTDAEMATVFSAISAEFFTMYYPDPELGWTTKTFYAGDREAVIYSLSSNLPKWEGLSFNVIER